MRVVLKQTVQIIFINNDVILAGSYIYLHLNRVKKISYTVVITHIRLHLDRVKKVSYTDGRTQLHLYSLTKLSYIITHRHLHLNRVDSVSYTPVTTQTHLNREKNSCTVGKTHRHI